MDMLPLIVSLVFLIPVSLGCLLVCRCRTLFALRVLQIGLAVSYLVLTVLARWIPMTHDIKEKGTDEETLRVLRLAHEE